MIGGFSLRKCAEQLNGEVTHVTLFYWRHKILSALKQIPTEAFQDIVEMDETYFQKGLAQPIQVQRQTTCERRVPYPKRKLLPHPLKKMDGAL